MTVVDVARYILDKLAPSPEQKITAWKLQKLVYYSQAWSLVWDERPLFDEPIEAWADGPVCPDLYYLHKERFQVWAENIPGNPKEIDQDGIDTIDSVLKFYGDKTGRYLSDLTHAERPWIEARADTPPGERSNEEISLEAMASYYGSL